jgi:AraC family transcriptional regulator of adaptative response/methylated-DNA-[protein]-cysteine methyltransferase
VVGRIATPLRPMVAVASDRGICLLEFVDRPALASEIRRLGQRLGVAVTRGSHPHLVRLRTELRAYFAGAGRSFTVPLDPVGTPFQRQVWAQVRRVAHGQTASYSRIAREVRRPRAVRAVGHANGQNPISVVIPCHRLVGADGTLRGYGGGLWQKRWLLAHEQRPRSPAG